MFDRNLLIKTYSDPNTVYIIGWTGLDCSIPDCGGCGDNGFCNGTTDPPFCECQPVSSLIGIEWKAFTILLQEVI